MFSRFLSLAAFSLMLSSCGTHAASPQLRELRICADPNNLPFTNERLEGFENKIADLIAKDLKATPRYTWWAQRRGFFRNTLDARLCDIVMGVPVGLEMTLPTRPYYRSTYVFLYRRDRALTIHSFDDTSLRRLTIGVQIVGDDAANTPPAHALSKRGMTRNVRGYTLYGNYSDRSPPARIVDAVTKGDVDVAVVWGPLAGYFSKLQRVPMTIIPVSPGNDGPALPFVFDIAVGVRKGEAAFRDEIQRVLDLRKTEIQKILDDYGIPRV